MFVKKLNQNYGNYIFFVKVIIIFISLHPSKKKYISLQHYISFFFVVLQ